MRLIALLLVALLAVGCDRQKDEAPQAPVAEAADSGKGIDRSHKGEAAPATLFKNPDGGDTSIAKFKGVPVLVNLWASWCAPCVKELPTLQKLEEAQADAGKLGVIAVSQDMGPQGCRSLPCRQEDRPLRRISRQGHGAVECVGRAGHADDDSL